MKKSAGILLYRFSPELEVFLVHPGGPLWAKKDEGAWSIPKGEFGEEDPLDAARREFHEETGFEVDGEFAPLSPTRQSSGKLVVAFAVQGDCDAGSIRSNEFEMEWPPRSGLRRTFPEVDRAAWFGAEIAKAKVHAGQAALIEELQRFTSG